MTVIYHGHVPAEIEALYVYCQEERYVSLRVPARGQHHVGTLSILNTYDQNGDVRRALRVRNQSRGPRSQYQTISDIDRVEIADSQTGRYRPAREVLGL